MKIVRNLWCAVLLATVVPVHAALLTNFTDQWWVPFESGWGAAVFQQGDILFIDIFVYDANSNPVWFTSTAVFQGQLGAGDLLFTGDLIASTGSYYGASVFTPGAVTRQKVGTLTFDALTSTTARLTYTVNGVTVVKTVTRQQWKNQDLSGTYYGGFVFNASGCVTSGLNGPVNQLATLSIGQVGTTVTIFEANVSGGSCNYTGNYTQDGHVGTIQGTFACTNGDNGSFTASEIEVTKAGIDGQFVGQNQVCTKLEGQFGGVRTTLP